MSKIEGEEINMRSNLVNMNDYLIKEVKEDDRCNQSMLTMK